MIDVESEQLIPLTEARKHPALRNPRTRKPAHASSVFRYALQGARATSGEKIRLETVKLPSGLCTSAQAIARFIKRLTDPDATVPASTPKSRQQQINRAEAELAAAGFEVGATA